MAGYPEMTLKLFNDDHVDEEEESPYDDSVDFEEKLSLDDYVYIKEEPSQDDQLDIKKESSDDVEEQLIDTPDEEEVRCNQDVIAIIRESFINIDGYFVFI